MPETFHGEVVEMLIFFIVGIILLAFAICALYFLYRLPLLLSGFALTTMAFFLYSFPENWAAILVAPTIIGGILGFLVMTADGLMKAINDPNYIPKAPKVGVGSIALTTLSTGYLVSQDATRKRD